LELHWIGRRTRRQQSRYNSNGFNAGNSTEFTGITLSNGNKTLTVTDNNDPGQRYEYSLTLNDGTVLDPKIINR
jgi:hypothetical protein